ncbi:techylectin-like protein [Procambarus clarkii]|uniref:techylectin-like protein n=1 Tax=Procambarus clarkii TaxID=6728 RepID=UPI0037440B5A
MRVAGTNKQDDHRWALWSTFSVAGESTGYQLLVDGYQEESTMGDILVRQHNFSGMKFSTMDRDNDIKSGGSCAQDEDHRGGWWYSRCSYLYPTDLHSYLGTWYWTPDVKGDYVHLQQLQIMTRPQNFPTCQE